MNQSKIDDTIIVNENVINETEDGISVGRMIGYFGILAIICITSFLIAKYILRSNIGWEETPIDTSERLG